MVSSLSSITGSALPFHCRSHPLSLTAWSYVRFPPGVFIISVFVLLPLRVDNASSIEEEYIKVLICSFSSSLNCVIDFLIATLSFEYMVGYRTRELRLKSSKEITLPSANGISFACAFSIIESIFSIMGVSPTPFISLLNKI